MNMFRVPQAAGAALVALAAMDGGAEAKMITYEVNGQRYAYSTNNNAQRAAARRHVEAASAAAAAKAKADAERASNPFVAVFGSAVQREAARAQAVLEQARPDNAVAPGAQAATTRVETRPDDGKPEALQPTGSAAPIGGPVALDAGLAAPDQRVKPVVAEPKSAAASARVRSVSFDALSGIKTTFMADGSIHEEPFDGSMLPTPASDPSGSRSLNAFVDQMRSVAPVETTGSTWTAARPNAPFKGTAPRP
jgi:hypothetical protein